MIARGFGCPASRSSPSTAPEFDPGREKHADLDIGETVRPDAVEPAGTHPFREFAGGCRITGALGEHRRDTGERPRLAGAAGVDYLRVAGRQRADLAIKRERLGHAAEQIKAGKAGRLGIARDPPAREQRLDLRRETERPAVIGGIERLDAVEIARQKQFAAAVVPDREGEHAAQAMHHRRPIAGVQMQQHLGIAACAEMHPLSRSSSARNSGKL